MASEGQSNESKTILKKTFSYYLNFQAVGKDMKQSERKGRAASTLPCQDKTAFVGWGEAPAFCCKSA